jgi:hypothetical protein
VEETMSEYVLFDAQDRQIPTGTHIYLESAIKEARERLEDDADGICGGMITIKGVRGHVVYATVQWIPARIETVLSGWGNLVMKKTEV